MLRKSTEQKQSSLALKREREKISNSINNSKGELEATQKDIKESKRLVVEQQQILDSKKKEVSVLDTTIKDKRGEITLLKNEIITLKGVSETVLKDNEELSEELMKGFNQTQEDLKNVTDTTRKNLVIVKEAVKIKGQLLEEVQKDVTAAKGTLKGLKENIKTKDEKVEKLASFIERQTETIEKLVPEVKTLEEKYKELKEVENKIKLLKQDSLACQEEIKKKRRELQNIKIERDSKIGDVEKRETEVIRMNEELAERQKVVLEKEKEIRKLGTTLQKHFDTHGMKHIKVFK